MLLSFAYAAFSTVLRLLLRGRRSEFAKDVELLILRHQLTVLGRQQRRPMLRPADRALLAALARLLPPRRRYGLLVRPQTLLRWHREFVHRKWTRPPRALAVSLLTIRCASSCCGSRARTRVGATRGSSASCASSACASRRARSGGSCLPTAQGLRRVAQAQFGGSSCASKPRRRLGTDAVSDPRPRQQVHSRLRRSLAAKASKCRGLTLLPPDSTNPHIPSHGEIERRDRLGGLIHEYHRAAA
jgi:hypothetical protein